MQKEKLRIIKMHINFKSGNLEFTVFHGKAKLMPANK